MIAIGFVLPLRAETIYGRVVRVSDGDTITVTDSNATKRKVRLSGIDAPERGQPYYKVSGKELRSLVLGRSVIVDYHKHDRFGRAVGKVLMDEADVNLMQVKSGLAWHNKKYEHEQAEMERAEYRRSESDARSARMGLWRDPDPVPPWEFRRNRTAYLLVGSPASVPMNAIFAIHPYKHQGIWVFDDPAVGLTREPFISGADEIIEHMVRGMPNAERGFTLVFSSEPFPGYEAEFVWSHADMSGNWYRSPALGMEGWLYSALLKYFESPPHRIYAQFRAKAAKASR